MSLLKRALPFLLLGAVVGAQAPAPEPRVFPPTTEERRAIDTRLADLTGRINALTAKKTDPALLADVDVYRKAVTYILRYPEEFFGKEYAPNTIKLLDTGLARAKELAAGAPSWPKRKGHIVRGYVSRIDGSVQPYGLTIPISYDGTKPMRLDIWLHGTQPTLNEVQFITQQEGDHANASLAQDYIQLEPLGRMNLSYRYSGETDVFEALASVQQRYNIDARRILIRGHSMGGQGAWHLGLQHVGTFAAVESSAGYADTYGQARTNIKAPLPPNQVTTLHYYDAVDYALNAFNQPTVGYIGETDGNVGPKKMREAWEKEGFRFTQETPYRATTKDLRALFLIGPKTGHAWHPETKAESEAWIRKALETADKAPNHVRCVTYTARFNQCHWVAMEALEEHYKRAEIDATRIDDLKQYTVTTKNLSRLTFSAPGATSANSATYAIDGQTLKVGANPSFEKANGKWTVVTGRPAGIRKIHGLQGPIDDAFVDGFLAVRGTGQPWNTAAQEYGTKRLAVFQADFAKWMRGDIRVKDDTAVSASDIANNNLILFGDPGSNSLIARVATMLPIQWTREEIAVGAQKFAAGTHVPVLVYPNPLNLQKYVVINSGHTFNGDNTNFAGTQSMFFPRLGDYAVVSSGGEVAVTGFFNEKWQLK